MVLSKVVQTYMVTAHRREPGCSHGVFGYSWFWNGNHPGWEGRAHAMWSRQLVDVLKVQTAVSGCLHTLD